jgi:hypothetical protein
MSFGEVEKMEVTLKNHPGVHSFDLIKRFILALYRHFLEHLSINQVANCLRPQRYINNFDKPVSDTVKIVRMLSS